MFFNDFYYYYAAGWLLHHGGNPYDLNQYQQALILAGYPSFKAVTPFPYPVWSLWFFFLISFPPYSLSILMLSLAGVFSTLKRTPSIFRSLSQVPSWLTTFKISCFLISFFPFVKCILFGQISWLPFICLISSVLLLENGLLLTAGLFLSVTFLKPHLFLALYGFILSWSIINKKTGLIAGLITGFLLQATLSYMIFPFNLTFLKERLLTSPHGDSTVISSSIIDIFAHAFHFPLLALLSSCFAIILGLLVGCRPGIKVSDTLFLKVLPVSFLFAPYAWSHDFIMLFPGFFLAFSSLAKASSEKVMLRAWLGNTLVITLLFLSGYECSILLLFLPFTLQWTSYESKRNT